jgi:predicted lipid carrier protein YhbT
MTARTGGAAATGGTSFLPPLPLFLLQPLLARIARRIAADNPSLFRRLGRHCATRFVIAPGGLPFVLLLRPDPAEPQLRAFALGAEPPHDARIAGRFLDLLGLIDGERDGDALFFSRGLDVTGDTEAVVSLRNALDDVEGSIAQKVADMFGPPGRLALALLRRAGRREGTEGGETR